MTTRSPRKLTRTPPCSVVVCEKDGTNPVILNAGEVQRSFQYCDEHLAELKVTLAVKDGIELVEN